MANILLVDPAEVSRRAMKGILAQGHHRLVAVDNSVQAWDFVSKNVKVDLIFTELKLSGDSGLSFLERLRDNPFFKLLPVVVYTGGGDREAVKRALSLKVQNFLIKPYHEENIHAEIKKAGANPWRDRHFEEEKSFCKLTGLTPTQLHAQLDELRVALQVVEPVLMSCVQTADTAGAIRKIDGLKEPAEAAGAWGVVELLDDLREKAQCNAWSAFQQGVEAFPVAERMIFSHINPGLLPPEFLTEHERNAEEEARQRVVWESALASAQGPLVAWPDLQRKLDALADCPVIDSVAATFAMAANGQATSIGPLMDQVERDPALATSMLIAANKLRREGEDAEPIINPRLAVGMIGEQRLTALARTMPTTEERLMHAPPCTWVNFRIFQIGVARMARYICTYLEMPSLEERAYTAGLLHDMGRLLVLHLYPVGLQVMVEHARDRHQSLEAVERRLLSATAWEMGAYFAEQRGMPKGYVAVMRWVAEDPARAGDHAELAAIVALARRLCRQNRVGWSGDAAGTDEVPLIQTAEWQILQPRIFPSFSMKKFEEQAHAACKEIRMELFGRLVTAGAAD